MSSSTLQLSQWIRIYSRASLATLYAIIRVAIKKFCKHTHTHTHPFNGPLSGTTQVSRYQKGKTNLDFTEARDSEWQWHQLGRMQVCTSLQTNNHASTPPLSFLQAGCPSCCPTNSVKALKAYKKSTYYIAHAVIFDIFWCNINAYFPLLFSAVYTLKIDFSVSTLRPCLHVNLQWFIVYKPGSTMTVLQISY